MLALSILNMKMKPNKGFTFAEVLIVIVIIAFLALIAIPGFVRSLKRSRISRAFEENVPVYAEVLDVGSDTIEIQKIDTQKGTFTFTYLSKVKVAGTNQEIEMHHIAATDKTGHIVTVDGKPFTYPLPE